jgi:hypothetical protein
MSAGAAAVAHCALSMQDTRSSAMHDNKGTLPRQKEQYLIIYSLDCQFLLRTVGFRIPFFLAFFSLIKE